MSAQKTLEKILLENPPFDAKISFKSDEAGFGWNAPELSDWLAAANEKASQCFFNKPAAYIGEGGSIPFIAKLQVMFPKTQFINTGVLGPKSNAHGPNEFLHIPMVKRLTACITSIIADHYAHFAG